MLEENRLDQRGKIHLADVCVQCPGNDAYYHAGECYGSEGTDFL